MISPSLYLELLNSLGAQISRKSTLEIFAPGYGPHSNRQRKLTSSKCETKKETLTLTQLQMLVTKSRQDLAYKDNWHCQRLANVLEELIKNHGS